jgi:hypothetical protein
MTQSDNTNYIHGLHELKKKRRIFPYHLSAVRKVRVVKFVL